MTKKGGKNYDQKGGILTVFLRKGPCFVKNAKEAFSLKTPKKVHFPQKLKKAPFPKNPKRHFSIYVYEKTKGLFPKNPKNGLFPKTLKSNSRGSIVKK